MVLTTIIYVALTDHKTEVLTFTNYGWKSLLTENLPVATTVSTTVTEIYT